MIKEIKKEFALKSFSFPLRSRDNLSYFKTLEQNFALFEKKIENLNDANEITIKLKSELGTIKKNNSQILNIIKTYLEGKSGQAYNLLSSIFQNEKYRNRIIQLIDKDPSSSNGNLKYIRIRSTNDTLTTREEMFHIPYSKRYLVANHRYSISGLPCLYLGSSIYVCWLELGRLDFGNLWISGFQAQDKIRFLNLAYDLNIIIKQFEENVIDSENFIDYFILWPITMACSFQVKYPGAIFHEEYIIPSLLLQWITFGDLKENITGLKYLSTKLARYDNQNYGINYVFPPAVVTDEYDFCPQLSNLFKLTCPLSWELMSILPPVDVCVYGSGIVAENIEEALLKSYPVSRFGYIEQQVFSMRFEKIYNPKK